MSWRTKIATRIVKAHLLDKEVELSSGSDRVIDISIELAGYVCGTSALHVIVLESHKQYMQIICYRCAVCGILPPILVPLE